MGRLTIDFADIVKERMAREPEFRRGLLQDAKDSFMEGDVATGCGMLRLCFLDDEIFEELAYITNMSTESLKRMFGEGGSPTAEKFSQVIHHLNHREDANLKAIAE